WEEAAKRYLAGDSLSSVARFLGVSTSQVHRRFRKMGVPIRSPREGQLAKRKGWQKVMGLKKAGTRLVSIPSSILSTTGLKGEKVYWCLERRGEYWAIVGSRTPPAEEITVKMCFPFVVLPSKVMGRVGFSRADELEGKWIAEPGRVVLLLKKS
ncbi:MAG: hypothetical protein QXR87_06315, partial [Candidatus Hadarchaeales archaeon]